MIQYIMPLPHRKLSGECNTLQPLFNRHDAVEDLRVFGCVYDLNGLNDYYKYKAISQYNNSLTERILYTEMPIFDLTNWWKSGISVYPVWAKTYTIPFCPKATIHRYLAGSAYLSALGHRDPQLNQTLFASMHNKMREYNIDGMLNDAQLTYMDKMVPGDDGLNLSQYGVFSDWMQGVESGEYQIEDVIDSLPDALVIPQYPTVSEHQDFLEPIPAEGLPDLMAPSQQNVVAQPVRGPFKIDQHVSFANEITITQDALRRLLWELETSIYTDVKMVSTYQNGFMQIDKAAYCAYIGLVSPLYDTPAFKQEYLNLVSAFQVYVSSRFNCWPTPKSVSLTKTWNEEVFIQFKFDQSTDENYLYDLAALSIGSPSFLGVGD